VENSVISIQHVSKEYTIGSAKSTSLRESINNFSKHKQSKETFFALKNINLEIQQGDVIGIIGKNGAGKSTLLKVLSQITKPSKGRIEIAGRVASLLEVGTGFHPELTGRENIYLNGTILGMTRKEVKAKFDEIVAFSGVEKFIDTPVKHYSSGMYVRLAFAVAAHLEPEVLIIDEVLAVGDAEFQKKCLGKMKDVARHGRTVLFVSHDLGAVSSLCNRGVYLKNGSVAFEGEINDVISVYTNDSTTDALTIKTYSKEDTFVEYDGSVDLMELSLIDANQRSITSAKVDEKIGVKVRYKLNRDFVHQPVPNIHFNHSLGGKLFVSIASIDSKLCDTAGIKELIMWIPSNFLNAGYYNVGLAISTLSPVNVHIADYEGISFEVIDDLNTELRNGYTGKLDGYLRPMLEWEQTKN
jgi:lipopolysaccharide transport system ATP-binding protein